MATVEPPPSVSAPLSAVVLAGGRGTRMKSRLPKPLHSVGARPMLGRVLDLAFQVGVERNVAVVSADGELVQAWIAEEYGSRVRLALQEAPRGTGDAVRTSLAQLDQGPGVVLILSADVPNLAAETLEALLEAQAEAAAAVAFLTFRPADPGPYGRVLRDAEGAVLEIVEARDADPGVLAIGEVNGGIYAVRTELLGELLHGMNTDNAQGELYLTHMVPAALSRGLAVVALEAAEEEVSGVNDRVQLAQAERVWRTRRNEALMRAGVTMQDPDSTFVADSVRLAQDVTLEPRVRLSGATSVAEGAKIGVGAVLHDCVVHNDVHILPYTMGEGAEIGASSTIGPFARLRPGTRIGRRVKIGNFVETKKSVIGDGSKASHLTYLGDATLGEDVNVGCGTITCNYDGFRKYPTHIGDRCLIGSDTALVAPVTLGAEVVTGAGSVITNDVPSGCLAVSRSRQRSIPEYFERLRQRYHRDED